MSIWSKELKKTRQREAVLQILEKSSQPLTAYEMQQKLIKQGKEMSLSTIYRIFAAFLSHEVIVKVGPLDGEQSFYERNRQEHKHYAVCLGCRKVVPMYNCPISFFQPRFEEEFYPVEHQVEMYGYCRKCYLKNEERA